MGNKQSVDDGTYDIVLQNLVFDKKCSDSRFGEVKWLKDPKTGTKVLQKDFITNTVKDYEKFISQIKQRSNTNHPKIIRILGHSTKHEDAFCANFYKISVYFEAFEYDLEEDLYNKKETKQKYTEEELWLIISNVVSACASLQSSNEFHGDIRPFHILVTEPKDYKILDNNIARRSTFSSYFAQIVDLEDKSRLYSPELFASLMKERESNEKVELDSYKSDVFSLGMTILQCAGLKEAEDLYDWEKFEIDFTRIEERLGVLNETYSSNLINIIRLMLSHQVADRPDFLKLESLIPHHSNVNTNQERVKNAEHEPSEELQVAHAKAKTRGEHVKNAGYEPSEDRQVPEDHRAREDHRVPEDHHALEDHQNQVYNQTALKESGNFLYDEEDLDRRIKQVLEKSAEAIRNSPVKRAAQNTDIYFEYFMNNFKAEHGIKSFEIVSSPLKTVVAVEQNTGDLNKSKAENPTSPENYAFPKDYKPNSPSINATPIPNTNALNTSYSASTVSPTKYGSYVSNYKPYASPATNGQAQDAANSNKYGSYLSNYQPYVPKTGTAGGYQPRSYASAADYTNGAKLSQSQNVK